MTTCCYCDEGREVAALKLQRLLTKMVARHGFGFAARGSKTTLSRLFKVDPDLQSPCPRCWAALRMEIQREGIVAVEAFPSRSRGWNFPYKGAGRFRERLLARRASYDPSFVLEEVCARLGPSDDGSWDVPESEEIGPWQCRDPGRPDKCIIETVGRVSWCSTHEQIDGAPSADPSAGAGERSVEQCANAREIKRKARKIVKLLAADRSLKPVNRLPPTITCGTLRSSIRSMYAPGLNPSLELSIKTAQKSEVQPCNHCKASIEKRMMETYERNRLSPQEVDPDHLERFRAAFANNVPAGWDKRRSPYVPNGHGTRKWKRRDGGNWNREDFSPDCRVELVWSSGKPRVVTLYSSRNVEVLTPLHHSLYSFLKGRNWLLVGSPTRERLSYLKSGCAGDEWLSFDYESATDNIKRAYVDVMIDVLIDKGEMLTSEEVDCLRVLSSLRLHGGVAESGQPMGSPMSFPLLCLINKTIVDMALTDLLIEKSIRFEEWTGHRCLINGDDLLTRSSSGGDLVEAVNRNGRYAGLRVNKEKTMRSKLWAEINSTAFKDGTDGVREEKKTNVSSLWMDSGVKNVVEFAEESTVSPCGLRRVVLANVNRLAVQATKFTGTPRPSTLGALLRCRRIRVALCSVPCSREPEARNPFSMEVEPDDFCLSREESYSVVSQEVDRVRASGTWKSLASEKETLRKRRKKIKSVQVGPADRKTASRVLHMNRTKPERTAYVMSCLVRYWENKRKEAFLAVDGCPALNPPVVVRFDGESTSVWTQISLLLRDYKGKCARPQLERPPPGGCPGPPPGGLEKVRTCE